MTSNYFTRFGEIIARNGIASIPDAIFSFQKKLGLSVGECWFVAQILRFKWTTELPRPSLRKMAAYTGVSERTLHNYKNSLVEKGYLILQNRLDRTGRKDTNYYDFSPLFDAIIELLKSKDNTANPIEETELEDDERVSENISDSGVSENFSDTICKNFRYLSENFSEHKQKNIQTEEYINNNNPPSQDSGNDTRPVAGVVVSLKNLYFEITGRDKGRFLEMLVAKYGCEKVQKAIEYLREQLKRNNIERPEGFLVRLLEEDWDLSTFDKIRHMKEKRRRREEEKTRRLEELMSNRRMIKQRLRGDVIEENDNFLECGRRDGQDHACDSLRAGVEETQNRPDFPEYLSILYSRRSMSSSAPYSYFIIRHMEEKRRRREEEERRRLEELMSNRASPEIAQKYLRMIKQRLRGDVIEENDNILECGRRDGQDHACDSLRAGVEETQNRGPG